MGDKPTYEIQQKHHGEWRKRATIRDAATDEEAKAIFREDVSGRGRPYRLVRGGGVIIDFIQQKD